MKVYLFTVWHNCDFDGPYLHETIGVFSSFKEAKSKQPTFSREYGGRAFLIEEFTVNGKATGKVWSKEAKWDKSGPTDPGRWLPKNIDWN